MEHYSVANYLCLNLRFFLEERSLIIYLNKNGYNYKQILATLMMKTKKNHQFLQVYHLILIMISVVFL